VLLRWNLRLTTGANDGTDHRDRKYRLPKLDLVPIEQIVLRKYQVGSILGG
jgi:hypothetical protein